MIALTVELVIIWLLIGFLLLVACIVDMEWTITGDFLPAWPSIPGHLAFALSAFVLASLARQHLAGRSFALHLDRFTYLTFAFALSIEILAALLGLTTPAVLQYSFPDPSSLLAAHGRTVAIVAFLLLLQATLAVHLGLEQARTGDAIAAMVTVLELYGMGRLAFASSTALPTSLWHALVVPVALLAGLTIAFLLDRFRPRPKNLPQAPQP